MAWERQFLRRGSRKGLGIDEAICSPTFTIVQEYHTGRMPFYHFDVYRIGCVEEMDEIGFDDYVYGEGLTMIEWANLIEEILPDHILADHDRKRSGKRF